MSIRNFLQALSDGDNISAKEHLNAAISEKAMNSLEIRKQEIAQAIFDNGNSISEDVEQLDEISLKTKIKAYAGRSTGAYEAGDGGDDDQAEKHEKSAEKIRANIEKKHGAAAAHHADRAADRDFGGRPMVGGYVKGGDSLKGGLRRVLSKDVTKSGTIPKQTQSAMKSMMKNRDISGPKGKLPEQVEQSDE